jgi:serine/threonine protein kinase
MLIRFTLESYMRLGSFPKGLLAALGEEAAGGPLAAARTVLTQLLQVTLSSSLSIMQLPRNSAFVLLRDGVPARVPPWASLQLLAKLHAAKLVHRDIKPSNILVLEGQHGDSLRLIDLGACADLTDGFNFTVGSCPRCVGPPLAHTGAARLPHSLSPHATPCSGRTYRHRKNASWEAARAGGHRPSLQTGFIAPAVSLCGSPPDDEQRLGRKRDPQALLSQAVMTTLGWLMMCAATRGIALRSATWARPPRTVTATRCPWSSWVTSGPRTSRRASTSTRPAWF